MSSTLDPSTTTTASPSTRRSTRPKRSSDTPKPTPASSALDTGMSGSKGTFPDLGDSSPRRQNMITQSNPHPWMHPQELRYIGDQDFPQNVLIQYLCSKAFSIPPREANSTIPLFQVATRHGTTIGLPRGYRVPLMFVAKFQWDSLKLVLTSQDPQKEWDEYKFDIVHLCRLCEGLFVQATEAQKQAVATGTKGIDRLWRSPTFDRVLTRFYHRWFVSREWSIRKFWEEFDDDEYDGDILKHDWARWALKGHKGFALTKDQIHKGITAQQFMHGLSKNPQGSWIWDESMPLSTPGSLDSQPSLSTGNEHPIVVEDQPNSNDTMIAQLGKVFDVRMDTGTPSHNTIEVKKERLEVAGESLPTVDKPEALSSETGAPTHPVILPTILEYNHSDAVTTSVVDSADRRPPNSDSTNTQLGAAGHSTSPIIGQKRPRSPVSTQGRKFRRVLAWKSGRPAVGYRRPKAGPEKSSSFGNYLKKFKNRDVGLLESNTFSFDSSSDDGQESSSCEDGDDPRDDDYRGPRQSRAKASQLSSKSDSTIGLGQASNTLPLTVGFNVPKTSGSMDSQSIGSSCDSPGVSTGFRVMPGLTKTQDSLLGLVFPTLMSFNTNTPRKPEEPELPVIENSLPSVPMLATTSSEAPGSTTASTTQVLSSGTEALSTSESCQSAPTPSTAEVPANGAPSPLPVLPSPQNDLPAFSNSSNSDSQEISATLAPILSPSRETVVDQPTVPPNVSEANAERVPEEVVKENVSDPLPAAEIEMHDSTSLTIVTPDVVNPDSSVDRHGDLLKCLTGAEPRTSSTIDTETPPVTEVVLQGDNSLASSSAPKQVDDMDVDEPSDPVEDLHGILSSLLSNSRASKVRGAILLLRGLLRGQQIQSGSILNTVHGEDPDHRPLSSSDVRCTSTDGEESLVMEEHLELVVKCSLLLSKYVTIYKGRELEEQMVELDKRLQQELSDRGIVQTLAPESEARNRSPVRVDKEVATMVLEDHSEMRGKVQCTMEDCQVERPDRVIQDPHTDTIAGQSLTPEATMVDLSSDPPTTVSTGPDVLKIELISGTIPPVTRLITSMMRDLADLLDCSCGGNSNDVKGKGRAQGTVDPTTSGSPLVGPLLNEFTALKEEMRKSQQGGKEGVESNARLHRAELKEQIRNTEDRYRRDAELLRQRHREEVDSLIGNFCEEEKQRPVEVEGRLPMLEMLELRRRVTALENHTQSIVTQAGSSRRPVGEDQSDITIIRRPPLHPLGHLFDYEDPASPVPYRSTPDGVTSASKPGTPIQSESLNAMFFDNIPLPIKSQRKFQSIRRISLS